MNAPPSNGFRTVLLASTLSLVVGLLLAGLAEQVFIAGNVVSRTELQQQLDKHSSSDEGKFGELEQVAERQQVVLQRLAANDELIRDLRRRIAALERRR